MTYDEAYEKYGDDENVSILVDTKDGIKALSYHNYIGGVCDCCLSLKIYENPNVIKVVNIETMKILFP